MENSWYLKKENKHHFICSCGGHDILENHIEEDYSFDMIEFKREEIDFSKIPNIYHPDNTCSLCGNEYYLDMNALLFEDITKYWSDIKCGYEEKEDESSWNIIYFLHIPIFNKGRETVTFEKLELSTYKIWKQGGHEYKENNNNFFKKFLIINGNDQRIDRLYKTNIRNDMVKFIVRNPVETLKWLNGEIDSIDELLFFLEYSTLRSKEIFFWKKREYFVEAFHTYTDVASFLDYFLNHRKEKSLRRIQFESYTEMMKLGGYNPMVDYIFSKTISDRNHLLKALTMDASIKQILFNGCTIENIYHFIDFLKRQYEEKHIVRLWLSIERDDLRHFLLRDSIDLFSVDTMRIELNEKFQKTPLNLRAIHHELTKHSRIKTKIEENTVFEYSEIVLNSQVKQEGISYVLPLNSQTLYEWGRLLHNCLFSYRHHIVNNASIIFGLFVDGKLTYALEIRRNVIVQVSSAYNKSITNLEREKIDRWHKNIYLKMVMQGVNKAS
jgi:hypothetical protein